MAQLSAWGEAVILDRHDDGLPRIRRGFGAQCRAELVSAAEAMNVALDFVE